MKTATFTAAVLATVMAFGSAAWAEGDVKHKHLSQEKAEKFKNMTPAEREKFKAERKAKWEAMSPEDKEKLRAERKAKWDALPDEQKQRMKERGHSKKHKQ